MYREPEGVQKLIRAIEEIGFDGLDMFDHVVMGYPTGSRAPFYTPTMPIMEAFMMLSYAAAITRIDLGTVCWCCRSASRAGCQADQYAGYAVWRAHR